MNDTTTEDDLQKAVARILKGTRLHDKWFHYPAENPRRGRGWSNMIAKGFKSGVPDVMIFEPWGDHVGPSSLVSCASGLAIELKIGKRIKSNEPSDAQKMWLHNLRWCGWRAEVCHTLEEVLVLLEECYSIKVGK